jgi:hypothetical protein
VIDRVDRGELSIRDAAHEMGVSTTAAIKPAIQLGYGQGAG